MTFNYPTFGTYFSGGELFGVGAVAAGYKHAFGVEYDNAIADVARANGFDITTADVRTIDPASLPTVNHFHASPSCVRASGANTSAELNEEGTKETQEDIDSAEAVCRYLRHHKPETFSLENVYAYRNFKAFKNILKCLGQLGYFYDFENVNSADFGVPQTRRRLILRASRISMLRQLEPTHNETGANGLPKWIGWYEAIEDLLDTLPESKFAEWQLSRLPESIGESVLTDSRNMHDKESGLTLVEQDEPVFSVISTSNTGRYRAFLFPNGNSSGAREIKSSEPSPTVQIGHQAGLSKAFIVNESSTMELRDATIPVASQVASDRNISQRAFIVDGKPENFNGDLQVTNGDSPTVTITSSYPQHPFRAWLSQGQVVSMTPRALARFQSLPDTYVLPISKTPKNEKRLAIIDWTLRNVKLNKKQIEWLMENKTVDNSLACKIIGNGVPSLLAQRVMESMR